MRLNNTERDKGARRWVTGGAGNRSVRSNRVQIERSRRADRALCLARVLEGARLLARTTMVIALGSSRKRTLGGRSAGTTRWLPAVKGRRGGSGTRELELTAVGDSALAVDSCARTERQLGEPNLFCARQVDE